MIYQYAWPQVSDGVGQATYPHLPSSLPRMLAERVRSAPHQMAVIVGEERFTYQDLWDHSGHAALYLQHAGIGVGDRVMLRLSNTWSFVVWLFGSMRAGALVVPTNYRFSPTELFPLSTLIDPAITVCETSDEDLAKLPGRLVDERAYMQGRSTPLEMPEMSANAVAILFLTSGTSGLPKAVPLSHENMLTSVETYRRIFNLRSTDSTFITVPLFHVTGLIAQLLAILSAGGTAILAKRFREESFLDVMQKHGITVFFGVPTIFVRLLHHTRTTGVPRLPDWRVAASGGAPIPMGLVVALKNTWPQLAVFNTYGMTEVSSPATILPETEAQRRPGSVGYPVPFAQLRVADPQTGRDVKHGGVGELWIRGPMVSQGYWHESERNACFTRDGWLRSGDLARIDDEGFVYIVDRLKDLINRGGEKISPGEVEQVLYQHPDILEVSVVGVPDAVWGENVAALVVPKPQGAINYTELQAWVSHCLSRYKVPRVWVVGSELPKNPNGKVDKKAVKTLILGAMAANPIDGAGEWGCGS